MTLPANCAACTVHIGVECRRHAPSPGTELHQRVSWPHTANTDRCGDGVSDKPPVHCELCAHWWQPDGKPIDPNIRELGGGYWMSGDNQKAINEWWAGSGLCTRFAPGPSPGEQPRRACWKVTHGKLDGCGDGEEIPPDGDDDTNPNV